MKKIINGIRYNTDVSIKVGSWSNGLPVTDFSRVDETLYKTPRSGRWFIVGEGGPMTRYAESEGGNTWTGGSRLIPITEDEAKVWIERHLEPEVYEKHFEVEDA